MTNIPSLIPGLGLGKLAQVGVAGATNAALNVGGARDDAYDDIKKTLIEKGVSPAEAEELA